MLNKMVLAEVGEVVVCTDSRTQTVTVLVEEIGFLNHRREHRAHGTILTSIRNSNGSPSNMAGGWWVHPSKFHYEVLANA